MHFPCLSDWHRMEVFLIWTAAGNLGVLWGPINKCILIYIANRQFIYSLGGTCGHRHLHPLNLFTALISLWSNQPTSCMAFGQGGFFPYIKHTLIAHASITRRHITWSASWQTGSWFWVTDNQVSTLDWILQHVSLPSAAAVELVIILWLVLILVETREPNISRPEEPWSFFFSLFLRNKIMWRAV